jgi:hypothetical protein
MKGKQILMKHLSPELTINEIKVELKKRREGGKPNYNFFEKGRAPLKLRPQAELKKTKK